MPLSQTEGIEIGFDEAFERKWLRFEHIVWVLMIATLMVGLAGGFGRGPAVRGQASGAPIDVEYERVVRYQTPTEITIKSTSEHGIDRLFLGRDLVDRLKLQTVTPQPIGAE